MVSDFFDQGFERAMRTANRKHDVIAVHVTDPRERVIPDVGLISLTDPETGMRGIYDTGSASFRRLFDVTARQHADELASLFRSSGIDFITIDPSASVVDPLIKFFRLRERRIRR